MRSAFHTDLPFFQPSPCRLPPTTYPAVQCRALWARGGKEGAMAERVRLAIVGCGGMGRRHLTGLAELSRTDHCNVDLVAVCDLNRKNAEDLADEAEQYLGTRPRVFSDA